VARGRQTLVFDADDTLWENSVLFQRVVDRFLDWLAHPTLERSEVRAVLNDVERANVVAHGYGSASFLRNLQDCFEHLSERPATDAEQARIIELASALVTHQIELIPEVAKTLTVLGTRHDLLLLTKGEAAEQRRKIEASNLAHHFRSVHIVADKSVQTYCDLLRDEHLTPSTTWMIGNSPSSDILPARAAGLGAVFIPNPHTWALEQGDLDPSDHAVLQLERFPQLLEHF